MDLHSHLFTIKKCIIITYQNWYLGRPKSELGFGLDQFRIGQDSDLGLDICINNAADVETSISCYYSLFAITCILAAYSRHVNMLSVEIQYA